MAAIQSLRRQHKARYGHYREESERKWANEGTGIIATQKAFDAFRWPQIQELDSFLLNDVSKLLPDSMGIVGCMGEIISLVYLLMGQENFYVSLHDNLGLVEKLYETIGAIQYRAVQAVLQHESAQAIWVADDIAYTESLLVSPKHLRRYLFPWFKKMGDLCHRAHKPFIFHSERERAPLGDMLVVADDFALPFGRLRFREGGGAGGHNGLRSIIAELETDKFSRLRIGIGEPDRNAVDHVLSRFDPAEQAQLGALLDAAADAVEAWAREGTSRAANTFNTFELPPPPEGAVPAPGSPGGVAGADGIRRTRTGWRRILPGGEERDRR